MPSSKVILWRLRHFIGPLICYPTSLLRIRCFDDLMSPRILQNLWVDPLNSDSKIYRMNDDDLWFSRCSDNLLERNELEDIIRYSNSNTIPRIFFLLNEVLTNTMSCCAYFSWTLKISKRQQCLGCIRCKQQSGKSAKKKARVIQVHCTKIPQTHALLVILVQG